MKKSSIAKMIFLLHILLISGCSYVEITGAKISIYDTRDALNKIELITSFLKRNGFVTEYDPYCTFDIPDLCKPFIHSTFKLMGQDQYHHKYAIGLSIKENVLYIRGVPSKELHTTPIDFENRLNLFLAKNFHKNEYKITNWDEPEIFR